MKKILVLVILAMGQVCFAEYGVGYKRAAGVGGLIVGTAGTKSNAGSLYIDDVSYVASGTIISRIDGQYLHYTADNLGAGGKAYVVFATRQSAGHYTIKAVVDVGSEIVADISNATHGVFSYILPTPITADADWYIGTWEATGTAGSFRMAITGSATYSTYIKTGLGSVSVDDSIKGVDIDQYAVRLAIYSTADSFISFRGESSDDNAWTNADTGNITAFADNMWIKLGGVICPDSESIVFTLNGINTNMTYGAQLAVTLDFTADTISDGTNTFDLSPNSEDQSGDTFDIYIWIDHVNKYSMVFYQNRTVGADTFSTGTLDTRLVSIGGRTQLVYPSFPLDFAITSTNATIADISISHKPIVIVSDSYGAEGGGGTLNPYRMALFLGGVDNGGLNAGLLNLWTQDREIFIAGMNSACIAYTQDNGSGDVLSQASLLERWNTDYKRKDVCSMRDVVVLIMAGINDVALINSDDATSHNEKLAISSAIISAYRKIASDSLMNIGLMPSKIVGATPDTGNKNDVIICGMIKACANPTYPDQLATINLVNKGLRLTAYQLGIPYVDVSAFASEAGSINHPDNDLMDDYAQRIVEAYEQNKVPYSAGTGWLAY